jgi:hypothetical protein
MIAVGQSDTPPASSVMEMFTGICQDSQGALSRWSDLRTKDVPELNAMLVRLSLAPLTVPESGAPVPQCVPN